MARNLLEKESRLSKSGGGREKRIMKKLATLLLGCLLTVGYAALAEPSEADQKWLDAVKKMVVSGQSTVSTPSEGRATLLKDWAGKEGYSVQTTKTETGYRLEVSKHLAQK